MRDSIKFERQRTLKDASPNIKQQYDTFNKTSIGKTTQTQTPIQTQTQTRTAQNPTQTSQQSTTSNYLFSKFSAFTNTITAAASSAFMNPNTPKAQTQIQTQTATNVASNTNISNPKTNIHTTNNDKTNEQTLLSFMLFYFFFFCVFLNFFFLDCIWKLVFKPKAANQQKN